ncbi:MAG: hypothetical protein K6G30_03405 [Acetatifactor sp.]|nr:hypothetical protein [Acetatifactor sp.]
MKDFYFKITGQTDLNALIKLVAKCDNDVYYESADGDRISLKSTFGQFIFFTLNKTSYILPQQSWIHCTGASDRKRLSELLIPYTGKDERKYHEPERKTDFPS